MSGLIIELGKEGEKYFSDFSVWESAPRKMFLRRISKFNFLNKTLIIKD